MSQHCGDAYHISYIRLFIAKIRANLAGGFVHGQSSEVVRTFFFEMPLYNTPSRKNCFPPLLLWLNDFHLSITVGLVSWNQSQQAACENNIAVRKSRKSRSDAPYTSSDIADLYGHIPGCAKPCSHLSFLFLFPSFPFLFRRFCLIAFPIRSFFIPNHKSLQSITTSPIEGKHHGKEGNGSRSRSYEQRMTCNPHPGYGLT
jgi:hypothetical protein